MKNKKRLLIKDLSRDNLMLFFPFQKNKSLLNYSRQKPHQLGLSLIEVMMALTLFAVFISGYMVSQGSNITDSMNMREEATLHDLCEQKIQEILINPPDLTDGLTVTKEVKTFESDDRYQYEIQYKKVKFPDLRQITGRDDSAGGEATAENSQLENLVYQNFSKNMEILIWQLEVTVRNKETNFFYTLSTWLLNPKGKVQLIGV